MKKSVVPCKKDFIKFGASLAFCFYGQAPLPLFDFVILLRFILRFATRKRCSQHSYNKFPGLF